MCYMYPLCSHRLPSTPFQQYGAIPAAPGAQGLWGPEPGSAQGKEAARRLRLSVLLSARAIWSQSYGHLICWGDRDAAASRGHEAPTCRGGHGGAEEGLKAGGAELADRPHAAQPRLPWGRQRAGGHHTAAAAPCSRGCPGCPRSSWSRIRRLWQREAPAAGAHAPGPSQSRSVPAQQLLVFLGTGRQLKATWRTQSWEVPNSTPGLRLPAPRQPQHPGG